LRGIDVSHYQGNIQWDKVAQANISFACAKATEGTTYIDPMFQQNWKGMQTNNITRCAYHFARPGTDPVRIKATQEQCSCNYR
jgi:lysozyme